MWHQLNSGVNSYKPFISHPLFFFVCLFRRSTFVHRFLIKSTIEERMQAMLKTAEKRWACAKGNAFMVGLIILVEFGVYNCNGYFLMYSVHLQSQCHSHEALRGISFHSGWPGRAFHWRQWHTGIKPVNHSHTVWPVSRKKWTFTALISKQTIHRYTLHCTFCILHTSSSDVNNLSSRCYFPIILVKLKWVFMS